MTLYAYDGASAFDLADAKAHGAVLITGYIVGHPGGMDPITKQRIAQIRAMGLGFLPNWERGADQLVNCGYTGGVTAGREAVAALEALGVPHGTACVFSWDVHIDPADYPKCGKVADGIIAGLAGKYRFSAYGQGGLIAYLRQTGRMTVKGWLSASTSFPGYDAASPHVAIVQKVGTPVPGTDQDIVTDPQNVGAWWPDNSPYTTTEFTMDAEAKAAFDAVLKAIGGVPHDTWAYDQNGQKRQAWGYLQDAANPAAIAAAIVAKLPQGTGNLTATDIENAVRAVFADAGSAAQ